MMSPSFLNLALLLSPYMSLAVSLVLTETLEVKTVSGEDCVLRCNAKSEPGVQYRAVRWYKNGEDPSPRLSGLVSRDLPNGTTWRYVAMESRVELLEDSRDIQLSNLTCSDRGVYTCHLAAPVGQQNRDGLVRLTLTDCPDDSPTERLMADACLVVVATIVLMLALVIFVISYVCLKNTVRARTKTPVREILLDAPLKPLQKKDLKLIYTLGPKPSSTPTLKHICV